MKHELTPEEKEARKAARRELMARIEKMNAVEKAETLATWDGCTVNGHPLSENNRLMLIIQAGMLGVTLSQVGGFRQWKEHGRKVSKGQKGMVIYFPMEKKAETETSDGDGDGEDGERKGGVWFKPVYVWDVSQTEEMSETERAGFRRRRARSEGEARQTEITEKAARNVIPERVQKAAPDFAAAMRERFLAALSA